MLKIGFARLDITPPFGTPLTGYFYKRSMDGVIDPLELNALAVTQDEETILVITADFMSATMDVAAHYRALISEATGVPEDHILTQAIHQHTSTSPGRYGVEHVNGYMEILERKYCDVAQMALDDRAEAEISVANAQTAQPISFVRRFRMKDGTTASNPGNLNPNILEPLGKADNTVRLVKITRKGAKDIALVGFATHPDTIMGNKCSADWPGVVRRFTEKTLPNVHCVLVNGCQGDTNHIDVSKPPMSRVPIERYEHTKFMGQTIVDTVVSLWDKTEKVCDAPVSAAYTVQNIVSNTDGLERYEECKALAEYIGTPEGMKKYDMAEKGEIRRIANMDRLTLFKKIPVTMVAFGKVVIVGFGGEPFTEYADVLREAYPDMFILTACNCNGSEGYLPSVSAYTEGGYEARSSNFTPEIAPKVQGTAKEMLKAHAAKL